jgi:hypothetical protein
VVHEEALSDVVFREDVIVTLDRKGTVKVWERPKNK